MQPDMTTEVFAHDILLALLREAREARRRTRARKSH